MSGRPGKAHLSTSHSKWKLQPLPPGLCSSPTSAVLAPGLGGVTQQQKEGLTATRCIRRACPAAGVPHAEPCMRAGLQSCSSQHTQPEQAPAQRHKDKSQPHSFSYAPTTSHPPGTGHSFVTVTSPLAQHVARTSGDAGTMHTSWHLLPGQHLPGRLLCQVLSCPDLRAPPCWSCPAFRALPAVGVVLGVFTKTSS